MATLPGPQLAAGATATATSLPGTVFAKAAAGTWSDKKTSGSCFDFLTLGAAAGFQDQQSAHRRVKCGAELAPRGLALLWTKGDSFFAAAPPFSQAHAKIPLSHSGQLFCNSQVTKS